MQISRKTAGCWGLAAMAGVVLQQVFNSVACYDHNLLEWLQATGLFLTLPLVVALVGLLSSNPLRAVGACTLFWPWLFLAYYEDCVRPYSGGGASMVGVAVILWGTPSAIVGAALAGPVFRLFSLHVEQK